MEVKRSIVAMMQRVVPSISQTDREKISDHLTSDVIGVEKVSDLKDITEEMLPSGVKIPALKLKQLMSALATLGKEEGIEDYTKLLIHYNITESGTDMRVEQFSEGAGPSNRPPILPLPDASVYEFKIKWDEIDPGLLGRLLEAKQRCKRGAPEDIDTLKKNVGDKIYADYKRFRADNPGSKLRPGRKCYDGVANQVYAKLGSAIQDVVNNKVIGQGTESFKRQVEIYLDNKRTHAITRPLAKIAGVVGIIPDEYSPSMTQNEKVDQEGLKKHLRNLFEMDHDFVDMSSVLDDLRSSYSLQRADILRVREAVQAQTQGEGQRGENEDDPPLSALSTLKTEWGFLFTKEGLEEHHRRLTGRDVAGPLEEFVRDNLEMMNNFLITSSKTNVKNLMVRLKAEKSPRQTSCADLAAFLEMVGNHSNECLDKFIIPVDKTTDTMCFQFSDLENISDPVIVAMDNNKFLAERFIVCADRVALVETKSLQEALLVWMQLCFTFDLEYPKEPKLVMELLERYVFGLSITNSKLKKKGKHITVVTEKLREFLLQFESFKNQVNNDSSD